MFKLNYSKAISEANRHTIVAGSTGSGKSVTLTKLIEECTQFGIPSLVVDAKGDMGGVGAKGLTVRHLYPLGGGDEHLGISLLEFNMDNLAVLLGLTDYQKAKVGNIINSYGIESLSELEEEIELSEELKGSTKHSLMDRITAFKRLTGAQGLFEPPFWDFRDVDLYDERDKGIVYIVNVAGLANSVPVYGAIVKHIVEGLLDFKEVGDNSLSMACFIDEAHLLFRKQMKVHQETFETAFKMLRSKGICLFLSTQSVADIPGVIAKQIGNYIQHRLNATGSDAYEEVSKTAKTFNAYGAKIEPKDILSLGTGEAFISLLQRNGSRTKPCKTKVSLPSYSDLGIEKKPEKKFEPVVEELSFWKELGKLVLSPLAFAPPAIVIWLTTLL